MDKRQADSFDAKYYIGSALQLKPGAGPVGEWSAARLNSTLKRTISKGGFVGTIYSYVVDGNGQLWWELNDHNFVQHKEGLFDVKVANETSGEKTLQDELTKNTADPIGDTVQKAFDGVGNFIGGAGDLIGDIGKNLKWYIMGIIVVLLLLKFSGK